MKKTKTQDSLPIVRSQVKNLLTSSQAFESLPADKRRQIADHMVKVANYLVSDASSGADRLVEDVNFPDFVSSLLKGVFDAIVNSSIRQMEAYAKLVAGVAKSLDEFTNENISDNEARDHLLDRLPDFFRSSTKTKRRTVRLASSRQQLLATMVLMGINRIVVTDGKISAKITKTIN
jgi:hypothetical protein